MKLFVYDHCPYCVRARMIFGLKQVPFELIVLSNDDEATPINMIGQKMVPILEESGRYMPESLDIVHYIDQHNGKQSIFTGKKSTQVAEIIKELESIDYTLVYPRFIQLGLAEFATQRAIDYFVSKKSKKAGSFEACWAKTEEVVKQVESILDKLENLLQSTTACNGQLSMDDICLFPILRNLTCVKSLKFPQKVSAYIDSMAKQSQINLYYAQAI